MYSNLFFKLYILIFFILTNNSITLASNDLTINLDEAPRSLSPNVSSASNNNAGLQASYTARYTAIGKDYNNAFLSFDHPSWKLQELMPEEFQNGELIHNWYLIGRNIPDVKTRFCYLFAAGRAGHYFAAQEAGEMLLNNTTEAIPLLVTLELLKKTVKVMSTSEAICNWDIQYLNQDLIKDPQLQDIYDSMGGSFVGNGNSESLIGKTGKQLRDSLKVYINGTIENIFSDYTSRLKKYIPIEIKEKHEQELLWFIQPNLKEVCSAALLPQLMSSYTHARKESSNKSAFNRVITYLKNRQKEINFESLKVDLSKLLEMEEKYKSIPLYWEILSLYYSAINDEQKNYELEIKLLQILLNATTLGELGDELYNIKKSHSPLKLDDLLSIFKKTFNYHLFACLLGDDDYCEDLVDYESQLLSSCLKAAKKEKEEEVFDLLQKGDALRAFTLQLCLLRDPDNSYIHDAFETFYKRERRSYSTGTKYNRTPLNQSRHHAITDLIHSKKKEQREKNKKASKNNRTERLTAMQESLKNFYFKRLIMHHKQLKKTWNDYEKEIDQSSAREIASKIKSLDEDLDIVTRILQEERTNSSASFKTRCDETEAILTEIERELRNCIGQREIARPVTTNTPITYSDSLSSRQEIRRATREAKTSALLTLEKLDKKYGDKEKQASLAEDNSSEDIADEKPQPYLDINYSVICSKDLIKDAMQDKVELIMHEIRYAENAGDLFRRLVILPGDFNFEKLKGLGSKGQLKINNHTYSDIKYAYSLRLNERMRFCILWIKDSDVPILVVGEYKH